MDLSAYRGRVQHAADRLRGGFIGACLERALEMDAVQRAIVLASQAFTRGSRSRSCSPR